MPEIDWTAAYASHLPVLRALGRHLPIRHVVEYGAGPASTRAFLDRAIFPRLDLLISYEDDRAWVDKLTRDLPADPRWRLVPITRGNYGAEAPFQPGFNLAFVDTGNADTRVLLVGHLLRHVAPIVVLHDYDGPQTYRDACAKWPHVYVYHQASPQTAVVSAAPLPAGLAQELTR